MKRLLLLFCLFPSFAFTQVYRGINLAERPSPKWTLFSFDANLGARSYLGVTNRPGVNEFVKNPEELKGQNNTYYDRYYLFNSGRASSTFNANVGLTTGKKGRILTFGINYTNDSYRIGGTTFDYSSTTLDTFQFVYGDGTTEPIRIDSVWSNQEFLTLQQKVLSLSADYVVRTVRSRVAGYFGVGGQIGVSLNSSIGYSRYESWRHEYVDTSGFPAFPSTSQLFPVIGGGTGDDFYIVGEGGELRAKTVFVLTPYIPIGIEYTPFLRKEKWNRVALELKSKLGTEFNFMQGTRVDIQPFASLTFGIKYFM